MDSGAEQGKVRHRTRKVTSEWSAEQVTNLIHNVECRPPLWDTSHIDYKNRSVRTKLIEEIATGIRKSSEEVAVKWQNLRSQYSAEQRKSKVKSQGATSTPQVKWKYFSALNFLSSQADEITFLPASSDSEEAAEGRKCPKRLKKSPVKVELVRKETNVKDVTNFRDELVKKAADIMAKPTDGQQIFGDYVAQKLREFPPEVARRAQFEIEKQLLFSTQEVLQVESVDIL